MYYYHYITSLTTFIGMFLPLCYEKLKGIWQLEDLLDQTGRSRFKKKLVYRSNTLLVFTRGERKELKNV